MARLVNLIKRGYRTAVPETELAKILQSEIKYEQTSVPYQVQKSGSLGKFILDWDDPRSQDLVLRRRNELGEEIAVTALLGGPAFERESSFPRDAFMKVCITKPGLSSILQFDCDVTGNIRGGSEFSIENAYYLKSSSCLGTSVYRGPLFSELDPELQDGLKEYLTARGIVEELTDFLLLYLHKRENSQYIDWLQKIEAMVRSNRQTQAGSKKIQ